MAVTFDKRGLILGRKVDITFQREVNGVNSSWTGQTFICQIRDIEGTLLAEATNANLKISYSTDSVANDTVHIVFPDTDTETFPTGTHKYELVWVEGQSTMLIGRLNFIDNIVE